MASLRQRFLSRAEAELVSLLVAMEAHDRAELRLISHRLAGIAGVFGFSAAGGAAGAVEDALDRDESWPELDAHCQRLVAQLRSTTAGD